jgi:hypothetical protein
MRVKTLTELKPEEKMTLCARADGWTDLTNHVTGMMGWRKLGDWPFKKNPVLQNSKGIHGFVPAYNESLDAMASARERLTDSEKESYARFLLQITLKAAYAPETAQECFLVMDATVEMHLDAYLCAKGLSMMEDLMDLASQRAEPSREVAAKENDPSQLVKLGHGFTQVNMPIEARQKVVESAMWVTCSPHEWTWTGDEQAAMARYCLWASQRLEMINGIAAGDLVTHEKSTQ